MVACSSAAKSYKVREQRENYVPVSRSSVLSTGSSSSNSSSNNASQTEKELKERLDTLQVGSTVMHKKFGEGKVIKFNKGEKFIYVKFWGGKKKFIFPDAFMMGFLEMV